MEILGLIVAGAIIGLLGKFVAPGDRDNIPIWLTVVAGVVGVLVGYYIAGALGVGATRGVDWIRWAISIGVAAVLVMLAAGMTGSRSRSRSGSLR
ncbi:MAG: GlsB/YeaQ/YmgE family stress response membrane protein [Actinomycetota bacterium]|nr:GlsB/YeaQ/YmgE family stress response membrane protein [Actinomycetota bacterium]